MKIIICCLNLYGGGAERVASLWANGFHSRGHEVILFLAEDKITYDIPNVKVQIIGNGASTLVQYIKWYRIFRKEFKKQKPDVFVSVNHPWAPIAKLAAWGLKTKVISTEHNAYEKPDYAPMGVADKLHKFFLNKFVDAVTVLTNADKRLVEKTQNNVYVMPNPLAFTPIDDMPTKKKQIVAVGRLNSWHLKGFDTLIKAWGKIAERNPEWKLKIYGYGKEDVQSFLYNQQPQLRENAQLQIHDFEENIVEKYKESEIFILSSRYEGFGMALVEAMSQGCACVACDFKGRQREIIDDGLNGYIAEVDSIDSLSIKMQMLIDRESERKRLQKNAIIKSHTFSLSGVMDSWSKILNAIC